MAVSAAKMATVQATTSGVDRQVGVGAGQAPVKPAARVSGGAQAGAKGPGQGGQSFAQTLDQQAPQQHQSQPVLVQAQTQMFAQAMPERNMGKAAMAYSSSQNLVEDPVKRDQEKNKTKGVLTGEVPTPRGRAGISQALETYTRASQSIGRAYGEPVQGVNLDFAA